MRPCDPPAIPDQEGSTPVGEQHDDTFAQRSRVQTLMASWYAASAIPVRAEADGEEVTVVADLVVHARWPHPGLGPSRPLGGES